MTNELLAVFKNIKEKTKIDIDAFSDNMQYCISTRGQDIRVVHPSRSDFFEVFSDEKNNRTYFKFRFRNANFYGSISGSGEIEKNYAHFILAYLENVLNRESLVGKTDLIKNILLGDCTRAQIQKFIRNYSINDGECFVMLINSPVKKSQEVLSSLENLVLSGQDGICIIDEYNIALVKFTSERFDAQSSTEFAQIVAQSVYEETGINVRIGVGGTVSSLLMANLSYLQSVNALKMAQTFNSKSQVSNYKEYVLIKMLEEIPRFKLMEFLDVLTDKEAKELFSDQDMLSTCEEFLDNNLNISETSRKLFMHRNTLMYRLDKVENLTGLNIKNFSDAVTFKLITILNKLLTVI